jgi:Tfp pilus assembly protein PilF
MNHERRRRPVPGTRPRVRVPRASASTPNAPAAPRVASAPAQRALVCQPPKALAFDDYDATSMFDTLRQVAAVPFDDQAGAVVCRTIAEAREYDPDALFGLAEVGYHYLRSGGLRLAEVIFDGLTAIDPKEPYFWLARGLVADYRGDAEQAVDAYGRASRLDPADPRPELNLAELELVRKNKARARTYLQRALTKANRARNTALAGKAHALLDLIEG